MRLIKIQKWLAALICLGLFAGSGGEAFASSSAAGRSTFQGINQPDRSYPVVNEIQDGLNLQWDAGGAVITQRSDGFFQIEIPGFNQTSSPGAPVIPYASVLVALPPGSSPQLEIIELKQENLVLPGAQAISPQPDGALRDPQGEIIGAAFNPNSQQTVFPTHVIEFEHLGVMRGVSLGRLTFYPALSGNAGEIRYTSRVQANLHFNSPSSFLSKPGVEKNVFTTVIKSKVINPGQVQVEARFPSGMTEGILAPEATSSVAIIEVTQRGITQVTYADLNGIAFPVSMVNPNNLHLYHAGVQVGDTWQEVAMEWNGDTDTLFESGELFYFYANPRFSPYSTFDTYLLTEESTPGLRMTSRSAATTGLPQGNAYVTKNEKQNNELTPDCYCGRLPAGVDGDYWAWQKIPYPNSFTNSTSLVNVKNTVPAAIRISMIGYTDVIQNPDHRVQVRVNNQLLTPNIEWNGKTLNETNLTIPSGYLTSGTANNSIIVSMPGISGVSVEGIYLDDFSIKYANLESGAISGSFLFNGESIQSFYRINYSPASTPANLRLYDVTDEHNPKRLISYTVSGTNLSIGDLPGGVVQSYYLTYITAGILSPAGLRLKQSLTTSSGDYLIISHSTFLSTVSSLVTLRQNQGLSVSVIDVQKLYDNYAWGKPLPDAIHAFHSNAYHNWTIPPLYALLVGDGTDDPKRYDPQSTTTFIPAYLAPVDSWAGITAADNRYANVDKINTADVLPDLLIGRLPVNSTTQATAVINKIVGYENSPPTGAWRQQVTFVADNADNPSSPLNNFPADANYLGSNLIPTGFTVQHIQHPAGGNPDTTRSQIRTSWNNGITLLTYLGHGAIKRWGSADEGFWRTQDLDTLNNSTKQPVLMDLTCLTGKFQSREDETLGESTLRLSAGGAVAVFGPTAFGLSTDHVVLAEGFYNELFSSQNTDLGQATLAGRMNLVTNGSIYAPDMVESYVLLGDPALRAVFRGTLPPENSLVFLPLILK